MKKGFAGLAIVGVVAAVAVFALNSMTVQRGMNLSSEDSVFAEYLAKYGKSYDSKEEYEYRRELFNREFDDIMTHNAQNDVTWFRAVNKFTDMTPVEINRYLGGGLRHEERPHIEDQGDYETLDHAYEASNGGVDWRGYMNPVRDQGQCGSCWAFASVATTEGRYAIKHGGSKVALSEQQLVDCSRSVGNQGCNGGWASKALQWLQSNGANARSAYPYTARDGSCKKGLAVAARITGVSGVSNAKNAIAGGPVAVYVQAQSGFMSYGGGIFNGVCGQYDHAVTAVGWGTSGNTEYWIIRNSWGSGWGEAGHIRVQINGNCRITFDSFPSTA
jgi:C1A family cysteine protease